jgi:hypothetical protein
MGPAHSTAPSTARAVPLPRFTVEEPPTDGTMPGGILHRDSGGGGPPEAVEGAVE